MSGPESLTATQTFRLSDQQRLDWLRLLRSEGVGPRTFRRLINRFGTAASALRRLSTEAGSHRICSVQDAEAELSASARLGAQLVAWGEPDYPAALRVIDTAPPLLAVLGEAAALARPCVAIVGARNASALGRRFAAQLAAGLGEAGFGIVSGLARGIDGAAHEAALGTGTIGVLAGGLARIYPPEHSELARTMQARGALVSEMPLAWTATGRDFPRRNRIISGLSLGTVIVEAALRSGSLITARFANEQGREVFAVPGFPLDPRAEGTNRLIREGAGLVTCVRDVADALEPLLDRDYRPAVPPQRLRDSRSDAAEPWDEWQDVPEPRPSDLAEADRLLALIGAAPVSTDDLARQAGLPARTVTAILIELELVGRLERHGESRVSAL